MILTFRMFHIRIFSFSTGLVSKRYDCMRFSVRLWLTYRSIIVHLGTEAATRGVLEKKMFLEISKFLRKKPASETLF